MKKSKNESKLDKKTEVDKEAKADNEPEVDNAAEVDKEAEADNEPEVDKEAAVDNEPKVNKEPEVEKKPKSGKKSKLQMNLEKNEQTLYTNWKFALKTFIILFCVMGLSALAIFFTAVKSPEQVLVPDVVGKELTEALQEMQIKELYPRIQLRYSNSSEEKDTILEQAPSGGAIVKAGRRVNLTVSQGVIIDRVDNYVGMNIDSLRAHLKTLFAASATPLILLPDMPAYIQDKSEEGTILEQNPPPNTSLVQPITLDLIVSAGPEREKAKVPNIVGLSLNDTLLQLSRTKIIVDFTAQVPEEGQLPGTVLSQELLVDVEELPAYSRIDAVIAIPTGPVDDLVYGILTETLPSYPYALAVELKATPLEGDSYEIVSFYHTGSVLTIPYAVPPNTRLTLFAAGVEVTSFLVL